MFECLSTRQRDVRLTSAVVVVVVQVYSNTPETINLIIEVFVEVAHKQICYLGEVMFHLHVLLLTTH